MFNRYRAILQSIGIGFLLTSAFSRGAAALSADLQQWSALILQGPMSSDFRFYFEFQSRFANDLTRLDRAIVRPALGYALSSKVSLWAGYAWTPQFNPRLSDEQRVWEQAIYEVKMGAFTLINRFRLEERFIEGTEAISWRYRHQIRMLVPFSQDEQWRAVGSDEFFVNLNSVTAGPAGGVDQNRFFLGINKKINPQIQLEGGYLLGWINRPAPQEDRLNHVILMMSVFNY